MKKPELRNLLMSGVVVLLAVTALVTRGYETVSGYLFYVWLIFLLIGVVVLIRNVAKLVQRRKS